MVEVVRTFKVELGLSQIETQINLSTKEQFLKKIKVWLERKEMQINNGIDKLNGEYVLILQKKTVSLENKQSQIERLVSNLSECRRQLLDEKTKSHQLMNEIVELKVKLDHFQKLLNKQPQLSQEHKSKGSQVQNSLGESQISKLKNKIADQLKQKKLDNQNHINSQIVLLEDEIKFYQQKFNKREEQCLQYQFELEQLKTEKQAFLKLLLLKEEEILRMSKERSGESKSISIKRELQQRYKKQQESEQRQVQQLKAQIKNLTKELNNLQQKQQKMLQPNQNNEILLLQNKKLKESIQAIELDRDRFEENNRQLQQKILRAEEPEGINELEKMLNSVQQETLQLREQITKYQNQNKVLKQNFEHKIQETFDLQQQIILLHENLEQKELDCLEYNKIKECSQQYAQQREEIIRKYHEIIEQKEGLQHKLNESKNDRLKLEQYLNSQKEKALQQENIINQISKEKKIVENRVQELCQKIEKGSKGRTQLLGKNDHLQKEFKRLEAQLQKLKKSSKKHSDTIEQKNIIIGNLNSQSEMQHKKIQQFQNRSINFIEKQKRMKENIVILEEQARKIYDIVLEKEENQEILTKQIEQLKKQYLKLTQTKNQQKQKRKKHDQEIKQLKKQIFQLKKKQVTGELSERKDAQNQNSLSQNQVNTPSHNADENLQSELEKYQRLLQIINERSSQLENELNSMESEYISNINELNQKISVLEAEKAADREIKKKQIDEIKDDSKKQKNHLYEENKKLQIKISNIEASLSQMENQFQKQMQDQSQSQQKQQQELDLLKRQNKQLKKDIDEYDLNIKDQKNMINGYLGKIQDLQSSSKLEQQGSLKSNELGFFGESSGSLGQDKVNQIIRQNQMLKLNINHSQSTIRKLKNQVQTMQKELSTNKSEKTEKILPRKNELDEQSKNLPQKSIGELRKSQLMNIYKHLKEVLSERTHKQKNESMIQYLINKNSTLEQGGIKIGEQRGRIQETARKLSMELQKVKSGIFKGKGEFSEKKKYLDSLKPCQGIVKNLVSLTETLSQVSFDLENC